MALPEVLGRSGSSLRIELLPPPSHVSRSSCSPLVPTRPNDARRRRRPRAEAEHTVGQMRTLPVRAVSGNQPLPFPVSPCRPPAPSSGLPRVWPTKRRVAPLRCSAGRQREGPGQGGYPTTRGGEEEVFSLTRGWSADFAELGAEVVSLLSLTNNVPETSSLLRDSKPRPNELRQKRSQTTNSKSRGPKVPSAALAGAGPPLDVAKRETHRKLKVMAGECRGKRLLSPADRNVRPMMEMVRGAVFNMVQALAASPSFLPGGRWLDLYSGTGSVGIEALSRGCRVAHFVEMDPWVVSSVLSPNLAECKYHTRSVIHTLRAESLLERAQNFGTTFIGGPFDYISVTPPYEAVVYQDLMATLNRSPLLSETTLLIVEYPLLSRNELPPTCGPLAKIRDRKYGRTNVAIYGPSWAVED